MAAAHTAWLCGPPPQDRPLHCPPFAPNTAAGSDPLAYWLQQLAAVGPAEASQAAYLLVSGRCQQWVAAWISGLDRRPTVLLWRPQCAASVLAARVAAPGRQNMSCGGVCKPALGVNLLPTIVAQGLPPPHCPHPTAPTCPCSVQTVCLAAPCRRTPPSKCWTGRGTLWWCCSAARDCGCPGCTGVCAAECLPFGRTARLWHVAISQPPLLWTVRQPAGGLPARFAAAA